MREMCDDCGATLNEDSVCIYCTGAWLDMCECDECGRALTRAEAEQDSDICPECIVIMREDYDPRFDDYDNQAPDSYDAQFGHYYD